MDKSDKDRFDCGRVPMRGEQWLSLGIFALVLLIISLVASICHPQEISRDGNSEAVEIRLVFPEEGGCCVYFTEDSAIYLPQEKLREIFPDNEVWEIFQEIYGDQTLVVFNKGPFGLYSDDPLIQEILYALDSVTPN
jgi:hypothetical protein